MFLKLILAQTIHSIYPHIVRWGHCYIGRKLRIEQFIFYLKSSFWIIHLNIECCICFDFPFILKIEIYRLCFGLLLPSSRVLLSDLFLNPSLESHVEFPTSLFQLQSCQVLLVSSLLIVKSKEKTFKVHSLKVTLSVEHCRCWEISILLLILLNLMFDSFILSQKD